jgi:predicted TIM-barrel fold metal-dependent hydrolase
MTRMIIDSHTHIINQREPVWGWGPRYTVEQLIAALDRDYDVMGENRHIDRALVMTGLGLTALGQYSLREAHQYVLDSIRKYPQRLYLNAVFNPRIWGADQLDELKGWVSDYNLRMIKIHPTMHNYYLPLYNPFLAETSRKFVYPVLEVARELGIPVMIHMGEPPYSIPASIAPLAEAFPDVAIQVGHSGANNETSYAADALLLARTHDNVFLGSSWVQMPDLIQMYYAVGAGKIIFESDHSPQSMGQQMRMVMNLHLPPPLGAGASPEEVYQMIGGNIARLCRIPLEEPAPAD